MVGTALKGPNVYGVGRELSVTSSDPSTSLLERLRAGEGTAWNHLVAIFGPVVYGWCRRAGLDWNDACDVGQEVFLSVSRGIGKFRRDRPRDSFRGWLWTIVRNKILDFHRRGKHAAATLAGPGDHRLLNEPATETDLEDCPAPSPLEMAGVLQRTLDLIRREFKERTWIAFWRVTVDGHSPADVAQDLGMTTTAVYIAKSRVLRRLREEFGELLGEEERA
jgi:RNA polymerase sigma-70 factor (ECF subfamily)